MGTSMPLSGNGSYLVRGRRPRRLGVQAPDADTDLGV
jgi:hypothetical protein